MRAGACIGRAGAVAIFSACMLAGCAGDGAARAGEDAQVNSARVSAVGVLRGGIMAIGGESTGWRLESGERSEHLDLEVTRVRKDAETMNGVRVRATGVWTTANYVERGPTQVLAVERLERVR